jgi:hypothetical protein
MGNQQETEKFLIENFGERMQLLESGDYKDLPSQMESIFPDIGIEKEVKKKTSPIAYEVLEAAMKKSGEKQEAVKILTADGIADSDAGLLSEDISSPSLRAILTRRHAPERKKKVDGKPEEKKVKKQPNVLLILKSPQRSWLFEFQGTEAKGTATVTDREGLRKAIADLVA